VDGHVISPTFSCGWTRHFTHRPFVISPTAKKRKTLMQKEKKPVYQPVTRARGF
jgi:hypothetical protein